MPNSIPDPVSNHTSGDVIGRYQIRRRVGEGGMGVVYEAHDPLLDRMIALKLIRSEARGADPRRFLREARYAAKVNHPNAVTLHEIGEDRGTMFIAMEFIDGRSASDVVTRNGPLPWATATRLLSSVCRGVAAVHAAGLVHRDIKPGNILIDRNGRVKVSDFGLAKRVMTGTASSSALTAENRVVGTPEYMSPEQCRSERVDARSDVYSLGATYYALLTARPPYTADTPLQLFFCHCSSPVPNPREQIAEIPERVVAVIRKAMAKEPSDRYQTMNEFRRDLERLLSAGNGIDPEASTEEDLEPEPKSTHYSRRQIIAMAGAAGVGALATFLALRNSSSGNSELTRRLPGDRSTPPTNFTQTQNTHSNSVETQSTKDGVIWKIGQPVGSVSVAKDGRWMAVGLRTDGGDGGVMLFDRQKPGPPVWWGWRGMTCRGVAISPDGRWIVAPVGGVSRLRIWDREADKEAEPWNGFKQSSGDFRAMAFDPSGKYLAAGLSSWNDRPGVIHIWNTQTQELERELTSDLSEFRTLTFDAASTMLAAASTKRVSNGKFDRNMAEVWKLPQGTVLAKVPLTEKPYTIGASVGFARTEGQPQLVVSGSEGIRVFAFPYGSEKPLHTIPVPDNPIAVAVSLDGRYVASTFSEGMRVWEIASGEERAHLTGSVGGEHVLVFAAKNTVIYGNGDKSLREYTVP